jgi:hypothetical protein
MGNGSVYSVCCEVESQRAKLNCHFIRFPLSRGLAHSTFDIPSSSHHILCSYWIYRPSSFLFFYRWCGLAHWYACSAWCIIPLQNLFPCDAYHEQWNCSGNIQECAPLLIWFLLDEEASRLLRWLRIDPWCFYEMRIPEDWLRVIYMSHRLFSWFQGTMMDGQISDQKGLQVHPTARRRRVLYNTIRSCFSSAT